METLVLEPSRAGVEGIAEEESAPGAPAKEETCVPEPAGAQNDEVVAAVTAQAVPENVAPVVQLPESSEEYGDLRDIDPLLLPAPPTGLPSSRRPPRRYSMRGRLRGPVLR